MKTSIIRIGNSRGVRLPKSVIEQCRLQDTVELQVKGDAVILRSARRPRNGWADAFTLMHARGDDALPDQHVDISTEWDRSEWRW